MQKRVIMLQALIVLAVAFTCRQPALAQGGTVVVPLQNVTPTCINATTKAVDFWVLSARVPKHASWITSTSGVGARVDVKISGPGESVSYPAAAAISTSDLGGNIVRASLQLHVLAQQDLWNTSDASAPIKTTDVSLPVTFVRRQGSSSTVKVIQALINFTNNAGSSSIIPPNPFVKGGQLVGQLFNSVIGIFQPDPNEVVDPNFSLGYSVGRVDTACSPRDLKEGVGAEIADFDGGDESSGIIKTADIANYCFYKIGNDADPNIGFKSKPSGSTCATDVPNDVNVLNNPQFIWLAAGTCKTDTGCGSTPAPKKALVDKVAPDLKNNSNAKRLMAERLGTQQSEKLSAIINANPTNAQLQTLGREKSVLTYLNLCKSVGISTERCLSKRFSELEAHAK